MSDRINLANEVFNSEDLKPLNLKVVYAMFMYTHKFIIIKKLEGYNLSDDDLLLVLDAPEKALRGGQVIDKPDGYTEVIIYKD